MGKGGAAPQQPDPKETAQVQTDSNIETALAQARLNAVNQNGIYHNTTYSQGDVDENGIPQYTVNTSLTGEGRRLFDINKATQDRLVSQAATPFSVGDLGLPDRQYSIGGAGDYSADRQRVEDALMGRLNKQLDFDRQNKETDLINRGIRPTSTAYGSAHDDFGRQVNDARTGVILAAGQEQDRLQQLDLNAANFANTSRSNAITEALMARNQGFNENMSMLTGSQLPSPQYAPTPQTGVAGTDVAGIYGQDYANKYNAWNDQQQQAQNTWGGLMGLGSSALMAFSDKRLKKNIKPTGEKIAGVPVKTWEWKGNGQKETGVIAQELEKKHPELVDSSHPTGYKRVNYGGLMQMGAAAQEAA